MRAAPAGPARGASRLSTASQALADECVGNAHGNLARVRQLIDQHPELATMPASWGETPIQAAAQMGHRELMELLLARGAPMDLFTAAALGRVQDVRRLLRADPALARGRGVHELPAMYFAAVGGSVAVAEDLLRAGAGVNDGTEGGHRALHGAGLKGHAGMVRWLLAQGADREAPGYDGKTALQVARESGQQSVVELLE